MSSIAIVNCFGVYDDSIRTGTEIKGLEEYFAEVAKQTGYLFETGQIDAVVLSGGYTLLNFVSEAESSLDVFAFSLNDPEPSELPTLIQTTGKSMISNLALGYLTAKEVYNPTKIWFYVDKVRAERAEVIARNIFADINVECIVVGIDRQDINPDSDLSIQKLKMNNDSMQILVWKQFINSLN